MQIVLRRLSGNFMCVCQQLTLCCGAHVGESVLIALTITTDCLVGLREKKADMHLLYSSTQQIRVLNSNSISKHQLTMTLSNMNHHSWYVLESDSKQEQMCAFYTQLLSGQRTFRCLSCGDVCYTQTSLSWGCVFNWLPVYMQPRHNTVKVQRDNHK